MDVAHPFADVVPGRRGQLLATLVELEAPVSVRALARHAGVSPQRALEVVHDLSHAGLVRADAAGSALMVSLNRDHLLAEPVIDMAKVRGRLVARLAGELRTFPGLAGAWLYGSTARGDGGRDSDIDLLLVAERALDGPGWIDASDRLRALVRAWTGNEAQLVEHTRRSFSALVKGRNALVDAIRADGIPLVIGSRQLLRDGR